MKKRFPERFFAAFILAVITAFPLLFITAQPLAARDAADTATFDLHAHDVRLIHIWRMQSGDDRSWGQPGFDDSGWPAGDPNRLPRLEAGIHWLRSRVLLSGKQDPLDILVLRFSKLPVAFEVYWDGTLLGKNGSVGSGQQDEIPGHVAFMIKLPQHLTASGSHLLSIRFSNFHKRMQLKEFWTVLAYQTDWILQRAKDIHLQYLWLGIYLISTLLSLALFFGGGRHRAFLVFAIYSFLLTLYLAVNPFLEMNEISTLSIALLIGFRYLVFLCSGILLNIFFLIHFKIPKKQIHVPLLVALPLFIDMLQIGYLFGIEWREMTMKCYSIGILLYAVKKRKTGSMVALFGVTAASIPGFYENINAIFPFLPKPDQQIMLALMLLFIPSIIFSISRQIREQNRLFEAARSRSQRLELELLKTQIQPHFISNTLHSARSWFRDDPRKGERLLQILSDEFQLINAISSKSLISIAEEIRLCNYHLEIMGYRRDVHFELTADNIADDEKIPPFILHTLIENGLTHAFLPRENGRFWLRYEKTGKAAVYTLKNNGSRLRDFAKEQNEIKEGLGFAYVRARLEENYPGKWALAYGIEKDCWQVTIRITE